MWRTSTGAKQELVACLGGYVTDGVWYLSAVEPLAAAADSLGVSAGTSIAQCGPPRWLGTVHTHVALRDGVSPYPTFSGADRGVMQLWAQQWRRPGIFCVLYSDRDAHCVADRVLVAGPGTRLQY